MYDAFCPTVAAAVDYKALTTLLAEGETMPFRCNLPYYTTTALDFAFGTDLVTMINILMVVVV